MERQEYIHTFPVWDSDATRRSRKFIDSFYVPLLFIFSPASFCLLQEQNSSSPSSVNACLSAATPLTVKFLPTRLAIPMPVLTCYSSPLFTCKSPRSFPASCTWHCTASAPSNTWYKHCLSTVLENNTWSRHLYLKQCVTPSLLSDKNLYGQLWWSSWLNHSSDLEKMVLSMRKNNFC